MDAINELPSTPRVTLGVELEPPRGLEPHGSPDGRRRSGWGGPSPPAPPMSRRVPSLEGLAMGSSREAGRRADEGLLMPGLVVGSSPDPGCVGCPRSRGLMMGTSRKASRRANEGLDDARTRGGFLPGPRRDPSRLYPGRTAIIVVPAGCCASTTTIGTKAHVLPVWGFELTHATVGTSRPSESGLPRGPARSEGT